MTQATELDRFLDEVRSDAEKVQYLRDLLEFAPKLRHMFPDTALQVADDGHDHAKLRGRHVSGLASETPTGENLQALMWQESTRYWHPWPPGGGGLGGGIVHYDYVVDSVLSSSVEPLTATLIWGSQAIGYNDVSTCITAIDAANSASSLLINEGTYNEAVTLPSTMHHNLWIHS